ncbi:MAG: hypothetical protein K2Z81_03870 [Cyanobacteria bacterium]|nr:hypothetical protein [Cyanobacteriota bacterium]
MADIELKVKEKENGGYEIVYPTYKSELVSPCDPEERLEWIRASFESFFNHVKDRDSLKELCNNP